MKISDISKRVEGLEESLKTLRVTGTTRIDWNCFTFEEQALFDYIRELKEKYAPYTPPADVLQENHSLVLKAMEVFLRRALDLFQEAVKAYCIVDEDEEPFFEWAFYSRIFWFIHELGRHCDKDRKEMQIFQKYNTEKELGRTYDEYLETVEDKTPLWSPESFENFLKPFFDSCSKKKRKQK